MSWTASAVAHAFYERLHAMDVDGWAELWHDDGRIVIPYPPVGFADEIVGKDAIVSGFREIFAVYRSFGTELLAVHQAEEPAVATVLYKVDAQLADGSRYTNDNVAVFETDDGRVRTYHDYFDPRRFEVVVNAVQRLSE